MDEALKAGEWAKAVDAADSFEVKCKAAKKDPGVEFYQKAMLASLLTNDTVNARHLYKRMPAVTQKDPFVLTLWEVTSHLWNNKWKEVHQVLDKSNQAGHELVKCLRAEIRNRTLALYCAGYSSIAISDLSAALGMGDDEVVAMAKQQGRCKGVDGRFIELQEPEGGPTGDVATNELDALKKLASQLLFVEK